MVTWKANGSVWPTDPKQKLAIIEMAMAGGNQLREMGMIKDIGWFSAQEGFAILEADSKAAAIGATSAFTPLFDQQLHEIAEWDAANNSMLETARQLASG